MDEGGLGVGRLAGVVAGVGGDGVLNDESGGSLDAVFHGHRHTTPLLVVVQQTLLVAPVHHVWRRRRLRYERRKTPDIYALFEMLV